MRLQKTAPAGQMRRPILQIGQGFVVMKIFVPRHVQPGETRCAMVPPVVKRLASQSGIEVAVESGLGEGASHPDADYQAEGASVLSAEQAQSAWADADIIITLGPPSTENASRIKEGAILFGMLSPLKQAELIKTLAEKNVTAFSMDFVPRISRAQAMDVLSSQANIGGYKAVLMAAEACPKMFPMMITAAGTIAPSKVVVLGVGVAGLQAIATAKRLGAVVEANDIRAATKEQVQSLGARFIELPTKQDDADTGGYAKELSDEDKKKQQELIARHIKQADAVVTTAAIFGKAPPELISADVVAGMQPGSVIVDLAADVDAGRGNCALTKPGETYKTDNGVTIVGHTNLPALVPYDASGVFANNMHAFLKEIVKMKKDEPAALQLDFTDEIQKGACITHEGAVRNELVGKVLEVEVKPFETPAPAEPEGS